MLLPVFLLHRRNDPACAAHRLRDPQTGTPDPQAGTPGLLSVPYSTLAGADPKRVPSRVAQRTQVSPFTAS